MRREWKEPEQREREKENKEEEKMEGKLVDNLSWLQYSKIPIRGSWREVYGTLNLI